MRLKRSSCNILVQSSNVDLGSVLPDYARAGIMQVASKYIGNLNIAAVHFNREGGGYRCTVNLQMGALPMMSGEADHRNAYAAFRRALEKVAKQLRRAKRELREDKPVERVPRLTHGPALHRTLRPLSGAGIERHGDCLNNSGDREAAIGDHHHGHEHDAHVPFVVEAEAGNIEGQILVDALQALLVGRGLIFPGEVRVLVHDSNADMRYLVLPQCPAGTERFSEDQLAARVTHDCMIGVSVVAPAP